VKAEVALQVEVNGGKKTIGKILFDGEKRFLYRNFAWGNAHFRKWDALSFDSRLIPFLKSNLVREIHYEAEGRELFTISIEEFLAAAKDGNWGEGGQLYVPIAKWKKGIRLYPVPWTKDVKVIE